MQNNLFSNYQSLVSNFIQANKALFHQYGATEEQVEANQVVLQEGTPRKYVYLLASGLIKVTRTTLAGQPYTLGVFGRGEMLGDLEVFLNTNYFCTIQTLTDCHLYKIYPDKFLNMLTQEPEFNLLMHQAAAFRLLNTSYKASVQSTNKLYYSLLLILQELSSLEDLQITKSLLTEFIGTSPRNLNRLLAPLAEKNIVQLASTTVTHLNLQMLQKEIKDYEYAIL